MNSNNRARVGLSDFVGKAIRLDSEAFKIEMRLNNTDKEINVIDIPEWTEEEIEAYDG